MVDDDGETYTGPNSYWADLTYECLINILSRLSVSDIWAGTMLVCKPWLHASKDPSLHLKFDLECQFKPNTESIRTWSPEFERKVDAMLRTVAELSNGSLTEIRVRHCSDMSLSYAADRCSNLQVLSIKSCQNVTDSSMASVAFHCPNLRELDISYCYEISHETLVLIGRNCPRLRVLKRNFLNWLDPAQHVGLVPTEYLNACPQDGDSEAAAIGKYMPQLKELELRFSKLTVRGLTLISGGCFNLEYLDLSGCANLTGRDIPTLVYNLQSLKKIEMPSFFEPRPAMHNEGYGHWNLYDERFRNDVFRI